MQTSFPSTTVISTSVAQEDRPEPPQRGNVLVRAVQGLAGHVELHVRVQRARIVVGLGLTRVTPRNAVRFENPISREGATQLTSVHKERVAPSRPSTLGAFTYEPSPPVSNRVRPPRALCRRPHPRLPPSRSPLGPGPPHRGPDATPVSLSGLH